MLTAEQIRERLKTHNLSAVSAAVGVHRNTLYNIANGRTQPSYDVLKRLTEFFQND